MKNLSKQSLLYLVQLVQQQRRRLQSQVDAAAASDPMLPDLEEELLDCALVANELQRLYETAETTSGNLPDYTQLVATPPSAG